MAEPKTPLLAIEGLKVQFSSPRGVVKAVDGINLTVERGETLAILGESGSGKSVSASVVMNILDMPPGRITAGSVRFEGRDLLKMTPAERRKINGSEIAIIFQDPLAHLNPVYSVGWQIAEVFRIHGRARDAAEANEKAIALMERVGISNARSRADQYPHQFSGGQRQRVMIAMALALSPKLIIADEPTTALDVTVQRQILELLKELQREMGMGLILITHDLAVAGLMADRVAIIKDGTIVESGGIREAFTTPKAAHTHQLLAAIRRWKGRSGAKWRTSCALRFWSRAIFPRSITSHAASLAVQPGRCAPSIASASPCARSRRSASSVNPAPANRLLRAC